MTSVRKRRASLGMTLIEVMVALVLLSLLSMGIVTSFRLGERTYRQVIATELADQDVVTAQNFLRHILESTYPFRQPSGSRVIAFGLEGSATELLVTAPAPESSGARGHYRYDLLVQSDSQGSKSLRVRWVLDRNGTLALSSSSSGGESHEETLLAGIESLEWAYLGPEGSTVTQFAAPSRWFSTWNGNKNPPLLVRLKVTFPAGDRRHWPELLIDTRVTDDSGCEFDMVSQSCRET
jgi:general secretion pathway protein J